MLKNCKAKQICIACNTSKCKRLCICVRIIPILMAHWNCNIENGFPLIWKRRKAEKKDILTATRLNASHFLNEIEIKYIVWSVEAHFYKRRIFTCYSDVLQHSIDCVNNLNISFAYCIKSHGAWIKVPPAKPSHWKMILIIEPDWSVECIWCWNIINNEQTCARIFIASSTCTCTIRQQPELKRSAIPTVHRSWNIERSSLK